MKDSVNKLNFILIIISFYTATQLPFELFLFSYAVLGPLHYLTEINWLNDKNYFINTDKRWIALYVILAILVSVYPVALFFKLNWFKNLNFWGSNTNLFLLFGFFYAIVLMMAKNKNQLLGFSILSLVLTIVTYFFIPEFLIYIGLFLPTLIHVYVFTMLFMVYGLLKNYSLIGVVNVVIMIAIPFLILNSNLIISQYHPSEYTKEAFVDSNFGSLNVFVAGLFDSQSKESYNFLSEGGIKIQIFIAFAYTYHYLNWFSKTSIIGWKNSITSKKAKYILGFWFASVGIYLYDYKTGLIALFFLSLLHVFLEFPLNVITIKTIFKSIKSN